MESNLSSTDKNCSNFNEIDEQTALNMVYTPTATVMIMVVMPIILCLGIITNSSFLFVVVRVPRRISHTTLYLAHLALADLLYLCTSAPEKIWMKYVSPLVWSDPFGNSAQCISYAFIKNLAYFSSIALVTMVSYERYLSLCHPFRLRRIRSRRRTYRLIAICWLIGVVYAGAWLPLVASFETFDCLRWPDNDQYNEFPSTLSLCLPAIDSVTMKVLRPFSNTPWFIAVAANTYMYSRMISVLNKLRGTEGRVSYSEDVLQTGNQVAKMVIVNGVTFFVCQTPHHCIRFYRTICFLINVQSVDISPDLYWIATLLLLINSTVNPLIYNAMNPQYRAGLMEVCPCKGHCQDLTDPPLATISTPTNRNEPAYFPRHISDTRV